jgi:fused signal recognition particle receptor
VDENQLPSDQEAAPTGESFDIATSITSAAESIGVDTFAFLAVPPGVVLLVCGVLAIFLLIRRRQNRRAFEKVIEDEIQLAEKSPALPLAVEQPENDERWTVPSEAELSRMPALVQEKGEEPAEEWTVEAGDLAKEDREIEFEGASTAVHVPDDVREIREQRISDWIARLKQGLAKTRDSLTRGFSGIFGNGRKLDADTLEQLHEQLYRADIGVKTCDRLVKSVQSTLGSQETVTFENVAEALRTEVSKILANTEKPLNRPPAPPWVILVVGVNGVGKTTTIGKLTAHFLAQGKTVLLAAADTFRAAAIEQLQTWGNRLGVDVIAHQAGADPAAVAYDAVKAAKARGHDILIIDTAGRLHSKKELMDELGKINRVIGKDLTGAPHETWLVIDATTGQNANVQVSAFRDVVSLTGLVVTKLDGTAKGGVVVGIADQHQIPIRFIGVGEKSADLREFSPEDFAKTLI